MSVDATGDGDGGRQRLRPWLEAQINGGQIQGLCWLDVERTKFKIPWKHRGKQDWNPQCGQIFMEWAKQTGRYREGVDKPDYVQWKTRLRCALHKAQDFEYIKAESEEQEDHPEPFRVYKLNRRSCNKKSPPPAASAGACALPSMGRGLTDWSQFQQHTAPAPIPTFLDDLQADSSELPSDLQGIDSRELHALNNGGEPMNVSMNSIKMESFGGCSGLPTSSFAPSVLRTTAPVKAGGAGNDDLNVNWPFPLPPIFVDVDNLTQSMSSLTFDADIIEATTSSSATTAGVFQPPVPVAMQSSQTTVIGTGGNVAVQPTEKAVTVTCWSPRNASELQGIMFHQADVAQDPDMAAFLAAYSGTTPDLDITKLRADLPGISPDPDMASFVAALSDADQSSGVATDMYDDVEDQCEIDWLLQQVGAASQPEICPNYDAGEIPTSYYGAIVQHAKNAPTPEAIGPTDGAVAVSLEFPDFDLLTQSSSDNFSFTTNN